MKVRAEKGLTHDLDTRCGDRGRTAGSMLEVIASLAESIHPVCLSAAQLYPRPASRFLTWPQHESPPPTAPHTWANEGAEPRCSHIHPPWRMKREALSPFPQSGLPITGSGRRIWWVRKEIGSRPSPFPPTDPLANPTSADAAPPRRSGTSTAGNADEGSLLIKESLPGAKHVHWKKIAMRTAGALECRLCVLCSQAERAQAVCVTCSYVTFAGRDTLLVLRAALALIKSLKHLMELIFWDRQHQIRLTTDWIDNTHTERLLNDKKLTPVSLHMLLYQLVITSPRPWRLAHPLDRLHTIFRAAHAGGVPLAFSDAARVPEEELVLVHANYFIWTESWRQQHELGYNTKTSMFHV